jgi:O-acetyl-ADP-ribose deacetylase (regulator of RNase III)
VREQTGDLWSFPADFRVVTVNGGLDKSGYLIMGAGVALQARERFPGLARKLGGWVREYGSRVFLCKQEGIITLPTKRRHWELSDPPLIHRGLWQMVEVVNKFGIKSVVMPRPGCGLGKLDWGYMQPVCAQVLDDRFAVVTP